MRLIDADDFKEKIMSGLYIFCQENKEDIARAIDDEPTAEPPLGKWMNHYSSDLQKMGFRQCSICKAGYQLFEHGTRKSDLPWINGQQYTLKRIGNFCPNCGARMRGGVK